MPRKLLKRIKSDAEKTFPGDKDSQKEYIKSKRVKYGVTTEQKKKDNHDPDGHDYRD